MTLKKLILLACLSVLPGCATIVHGGSHQGVGISSTPPGAKVTVDGVPSGVTPVIVDMKRNRDHKVEVALDGFSAWSGTLEPSVSGWVWGNIAFGGLIGLGVDFMSGGAYQLYPENLSATLQASPTNTVARQ
jgi:PEGA domain